MLRTIIITVTVVALLVVTVGPTFADGPIIRKNTTYGYTVGPYRIPAYYVQMPTYNPIRGAQTKARFGGQ